jgi:hypothetical protein
VTLPVLTTPEADAQIRSIDGWWRANRLGSPNLFADELASSFELIGQAPSGAPCNAASGVGCAVKLTQVGLR